MTLTLDLTPELKAQVEEEAARTGVDAVAFVMDALREKLRSGTQRPSSLPSRLSKEETALLLKVNEGMAENLVAEYKALTAKRQAETLTPQEHIRLIELTNQREVENARRMEYLAQLARLRNISLREAMKQLGIVSPGHV